jgi:Flp pilus assembly protein TadD
LGALTFPSLRRFRGLLLAGIAAAALTACASNRTDVRQPDFSHASRQQSEQALVELSARYKAHPSDKATILYYAAALRSVGQPEQAVSVIEAGLAILKNDVDLKVAYAKALSAAGRFDQALNVIQDAINPAQPDWNALLVEGAILDQSGRNADARAIYAQALTVAPGQAAIEANIGLSYAMGNDLTQAETHLRRAQGMQGVTSQIRQNWALVVGLQGRFDEARALFAAELPPDQVEANMAYIRAMLTQQNRWDLVKGAK